MKVNLDSEAQYAFTERRRGHMFSHYDGVLAVDGGLGDKRAYDPRAWGAEAEAGMAARVAHGLRAPRLGRTQHHSLIRSRNARASGDHSARVNAHSSRERGGSRLRAARRCGPARMCTGTSAGPRPAAASDGTAAI